MQYIIGLLVPFLFVLDASAQDGGSVSAKNEVWIKAAAQKGSVHRLRPDIGSRNGDFATVTLRVDFEKPFVDSKGRKMDRREVLFLIACEEQLMRHEELRVYLQETLVAVEPRDENADPLIVQIVPNGPAHEAASLACG